jgi:hypothetical protein
MRLDRETQTPFSRTELLMQVSELRARLEHLVAQYDRLVRGLSGDAAASVDLDSRLHLINREIAHLAGRAQELFVREHETRGQEKSRPPAHPVNSRCGEPRQAAPVHQSVRSSVVRPFVSSAYKRAVAAASDSTRFAAAR